VIVKNASQDISDIHGRMMRVLTGKVERIGEGVKNVKPSSKLICLNPFPGRGRDLGGSAVGGMPVWAKGGTFFFCANEDLQKEIKSEEIGDAAGRRRQSSESIDPS